MKDLFCWVWLSMMDRMTADKVEMLMKKFGSAENIYNASREDYMDVELLDRADINNLCRKKMNTVAGVIEKMRMIGGNIITYNNPSYPPLLKCISDPPTVLYTRGIIPKWSKLSTIGVVGTRKYSDYGLNATERICTGLARAGITIVSGMARGIDSIAAKTALKNGAKTIAVLGCGVDVVYPPENDKLMDAIIANGLIVSEYPPGTTPSGWHFPVRNRIISGLSQGVLICEAPEKSGALITAGLAVDNNRDVFAVPGSIFDVNYTGSNRLIQMGAKLVTEAEDILEEYASDANVLKLINKSRLNKRYAPAVKITEENIKFDDIEITLEELEKTQKKRAPQKKEEDREEKSGLKKNNPKESVSDEKTEQKTVKRRPLEELARTNEDLEILRIIEDGAKSIEDIADKTDIDINTLNTRLVVMEMNGVVERMPGNLYKLIS